ncbi:MAG: threonyl-tRNA synthetase editing domain-containing protein [Blastocatellia bacterium]|nr:threonyl-tRNA synthetase editing domain-containing protein [Blastocatellia bacterium]
MRMLMIHVDAFRSELTEKGRSKLIEEPIERVVAVEEAIVILTAVEKSDESNPTLVVQRAAQEIETIARQLKVSTLVVHSFAHLFAELANPTVAVDVLKELASTLAARGFTTYRSPFGWFNTLEIKAKGHPLSRIARTIPAN